MYRIVKTKEMILMYNNNQECFDIEITAKDILLPAFEFKGEIIDEDSASLLQYHPIQSNKLNAYMSTPRFFKCLTDLSRNISHLKQKTLEEKRKMVVH